VGAISSRPERLPASLRAIRAHEDAEDVAAAREAMKDRGLDPVGGSQEAELGALT